MKAVSNSMSIGQAPDWFLAGEDEDRNAEVLRAPWNVKPTVGIGEQMTTEQIARVCHEVNRAYCLSMGDESQPSWEDAPDWQKQSAIAGVEAIKANPGTTPRASHEGWLEQKRADGWKYGRRKNAETKEHPCFVDYDDLPEKQKAKDYLFGAVVRSLI